MNTRDFSRLKVKLYTTDSHLVCEIWNLNGEMILHYGSAARDADEVETIQTALQCMCEADWRRVA